MLLHRSRRQRAVHVFHDGPPRCFGLRQLASAMSAQRAPRSSAVIASSNFSAAFRPRTICSNSVDASSNDDALTSVVFGACSDIASPTPTSVRTCAAAEAASASRSCHPPAPDQPAAAMRRGDTQRLLGGPRIIHGSTRSCASGSTCARRSPPTLSTARGRNGSSPAGSCPTSGAERGRSRARPQRRIDDVVSVPRSGPRRCRGSTGAGARRVEQVLVGGEHRLRAVAVVHVEVHHRDACTPQRARACSAATAALLNRRNPIGRAGSAWCPGGRTAADAARAQPSITASTPAPGAAPRNTASALPALIAVSASGAPFRLGGTKSTDRLDVVRRMDAGQLFGGGVRAHLAQQVGDSGVSSPASTARSRSGRSGWYGPISCRRQARWWSTLWACQSFCSDLRRGGGASWIAVLFGPASGTWPVRGRTPEVGG